MGCLKKIIKTIIFIVIVCAFFMCGGYSFVKNKYTSYTKPERNVLINEEKDFGSLENISADYALTRSLNFFGYRKINANYLPKNQKITILDLNSRDVLSEKDFKEDKIEEKLEEFSNKIINSPVIPIQNIKTTDKGQILSGTKLVPYINFTADVKYIPFLTVRGTIAVYETSNKNSGAVSKIKDKIQKNNENITSKLVISTKFSNDYEEEITKKFISEIKL